MEKIEDIAAEMREKSQWYSVHDEKPFWAILCETFVYRIKEAYRSHLTHGEICTMACRELGLILDYGLDAEKRLAKEVTRLKAVSSEMREALEEAIGQSCMECIHDCAECVNLNHHWIPKAKAAIAKTDGKENKDESEKND